ncbi:unnamed protein product [Thelazia callipaeda]|uniref:Sushi domain-containing protein n=1 Tax=Thelazia callipaeda TaxID=103827 RepID=A0A158RBN6_THECL|nr:unnamed protein product [Thelazia callipaeda]
MLISEEILAVCNDSSENCDETSARFRRFKFPSGLNDNAIYLNGSAALRLSTPKWPILVGNMRFAFTLEIWIQIDGGQTDFATIVALNDICGDVRARATWKLSIETEHGGEYGARLQLSVASELLPQSYHIRNEKPHKLGEWLQIVAVFDSHQLLLYVNGARVGKLMREFGALYSELRSACKRLYLGADGGRFRRDEVIGFRGFIGKLRITDRPMHHLNFYEEQWMGNIIEDNFLNTDQWKLLGKNDMPQSIEIPACGQTICDSPIVISNYLQQADFTALKKLRYRVIVISDDDGSNVNMESDQITLQHLKLSQAFAPYNITWELEVINIRNTSLRRKTIVFGCHSSAIGNKRCDIECRHAVTGDDGGDCKTQNILSYLKSKCEKWMPGNKHCDLQCNNREHNWDNADCCTNFVDSDNRHCIDPSSVYRLCSVQCQFRRYINVEEYKASVAMNNEKAMNVQFGSWEANDLSGFSTFPWEKDIYGNQGGVLLRHDRFGTPGQVNTLIHEVGHILGLWHVHHGISEVPCGDPCQEKTPSMTTGTSFCFGILIRFQQTIVRKFSYNYMKAVLGDMVNDTNPTIKNTACADPETVNPCDVTQEFKDTPFRNYMSYAGDNCANTFTPQQKARMHCYIDLKYTNWLVRSAPIPKHITLAPRIVPWPETNSRSVKIMWIPPFDSMNCGPQQKRVRETHCTVDNRVVQYAVSASSSEPFQMSGIWGPEQATGTILITSYKLISNITVQNLLNDQKELIFTKLLGPPDAEPCSASTKAWLPDVQDCDDASDKCTLKLKPDVETEVEKLSIWFAWNAASGVRFVKIQFTDGSVELFEQLYAHCDQPLTLRLNSRKWIKEVQVRSNNPFVSIDAVEFVSSPQNSFCSHCIPYHYRVYRTPSFSERFIETTNYHIIDRFLFFTNFICKKTYEILHCHTLFHFSTVQQGVTYTYSVTVESKGVEGLYSPTARYSTEMNVCGDGKRSNDEQCDDGNLYNSDGCSQDCLVEEKFHCVEVNKSTASFCYVYEGDNECEAFEESYDKDCKSIDPSTKYSQYYPVNVHVYSATLRRNCSLHLHSSLTSGCDVQSSSSRTCLQQSDLDELFLHASFQGGIFPTSVIIGYATVFKIGSKSVLSTIRISVQYINKTTISLDEQRILSCAQNPLEVAIPYMLINKLSYAKAVYLYISNPDQIVITAVILRSLKIFDLPTLQTCAAENKFYDPVSGFCVSKNCQSMKSASCIPLSVPKSKRKCHELICIYKCEDGFMLENSQKAAKIRCVNGHWIGTGNLNCQPVHCSVPKLEYAEVDCPDGTNYNKKCTFRCKDNAMMIGQKNYMVCKENGLWTLPEAFCQHKYSICKKDGTWSNNFQCPSPRKNCLLPAVMRDLQFKCPRRLVSGAACLVQCHRKGYDAALEDNKILPNGERLLSFRVVHSITCTISSTFYPQVHTLSCVRSCNKEFMGDGWCDFQNNRGYCKWDGGDCCASTVRGGHVRLMFPSLCTSVLCQCIDPFAVENKALSFAVHDANNIVRERKIAMKRAVRDYTVNADTSSSDQVLDTSAISSVKALFSPRDDIYMDDFENQQDDKRKSIMSLNKMKDWKEVAWSVKSALRIRQQQFKNKM